MTIAQAAYDLERAMPEADRPEAIQLMRGVAAGMVVIAHLTYVAALDRYFGLGVTMFFVISGFVISHSMNTRRIEQQRSLRTRHIRKARRSAMRLASLDQMPVLGGRWCSAS